MLMFLTDEAGFYVVKNVVFRLPFSAWSGRGQAGSLAFATAGETNLQTTIYTYIYIYTYIHLFIYIYTHSIYTIYIIYIYI